MQLQHCIQRKDTSFTRTEGVRLVKCIKTWNKLDLIIFKEVYLKYSNNLVQED